MWLTIIAFIGIALILFFVLSLTRRFPFLDSWLSRFALGLILGGTIGTSLYMASVGLAISCRAGRRAFANAGVIAYFLFLPAMQAIFYSISSGDAKRYSVLVNPVLLTRGFADWLFNIEAKRRSVIGRVDLPGEVYLYAILGVALVMGSLVVLKYRKADV